MKNCIVKIYDAEDVLESGHRVSEDTTLVYEGPAQFSSPQRAWQQTAALEGLISGFLHLHLRADVTAARVVEIEDHIQAGFYRVADNGVSGSGVKWTLTLQRRRTLAPA